MLLAIDTSTRYAGVALADGDRVLECRCWYSTVNHTVELMPAVAQVLRGRGLATGDLQGIAVALGPGGFSALRVGLSVAKGLAAAARRPLAGVDTLELEAHPYLASGLPVCALLDAGRGEVASAQFGPAGRRTREDRVCSPDELLASIDGPTLFCGEAVAGWSGLIKERLGPLGVVALTAPASRLWALAELGGQRLASGDISEPVTVQPYYLRMPSVGVPKRRDWIPQASS